MKVKRYQQVETDSLQEGDLLTIDGVQWIVIKADGEDITVQQYDHIEDHVFNDDGSNKYEGSDLQEFLKEYRKRFKSKALGEFYILPMEAYEDGFLSDPRNRIRFNDNGYGTYYWTASPTVGIGNLVRGIFTSGSVVSYGAYISYGVAPACKLNLASLIGTDRCREKLLTEIRDLLQKVAEAL